MIPKRYLLVFGAFLLSMLLYVDRACISTAKDAIYLDFGFSDRQWGWIMGAVALGYALCQTPAGLMADRFGPRRILTAVVAFWSLFTCLTGAAWGSIRLYPDGRLTVQPLGKEETEHAYAYERRGFGGDCVYATQRHFVDCITAGRPFETDGEDYLRTLAVQEAVYRSAETRQPVRGISKTD